MAYYETDKIVAEYLLFHYGTSAEQLSSFTGVIHPPGVLNFPVRCITETLGLSPSGGCALDLGCAVGRSTFEFARLGMEAVGIDFSLSFIQAAERLRIEGFIKTKRLIEGDIEEEITVRLPEGVPTDRVRFIQGDAMQPPADIGVFDAVLMANLIDRLSDPLRCLRHLPSLVKPGGKLVITSPYTWLDEFTPREKWLGGFYRNNTPVHTLDGLRNTLQPAFECVKVVNLPFMIREHARKYQWSVAEASVWLRR